MAELYLDSLRIKDFGPFYGEHQFDFSSDGGRRSILIGGKNGAGKTHLLRALYLGVVGQSGAVDLRKIEAGSDATKFDLEESLNRRARGEGIDSSLLEISLSLRDETGSTGRAIRIERNIRYRPASRTVFSSRIYKVDDDVWIEDEEAVHRLRDMFLPRHLARFFFFDAERSQSINLSEKEITEGISRVLGLYSYSELEEDLRKLASNKIPKKYGSGSDQELKLNAISAEIQKSSADLKSYRNELEDVERELDDICHDLVDIEEDLRSIGAVDPDQLQAVQDQRELIKESKFKLEEKLSTAWEFSLPISLLGSYRTGLSNDLVREERRRDWENRKSSVEPKIPRIRKEVFHDVPEKHVLDKATRSFYEEKLEQALQGLFHPPEAGMADAVFIVPERNEVSVRIRNQLLEQPRLVSSLAKLSETLDHKASELREMDQKLKQFVADQDVIERGNELRERRGELSVTQVNLEDRKKEIDSRIKQLENSLRESKKEETKLSEQVQKIKQGRSLHNLAHRYRAAVSEIKQKAAVKLRNKISDTVGDLWLDITERVIEYRSMEFDKNWNCFLVKPDGSRVRWDSANTSAGQRQVRILAFTEALRRLARFVPPLVVDTPLGRLDKEVKESTLERLYLTGHQSIILTTNSEIAPMGDLFGKISTKLARVYTLNPVGDPDSQTYHVEVANDYFKRIL